MTSISITLLKCRNLPSQKNILTGHTCNPYVLIHEQAVPIESAHRSKVVEKSINPFFNETFIIHFKEDPSSAKLLFHVNDHHIIEKNRKIGSGYLMIADLGLVKGKVRTINIPLDCEDDAEIVVNLCAIDFGIEEIAVEEIMGHVHGSITEMKHSSQVSQAVHKLCGSVSTLAEDCNDFFNSCRNKDTLSNVLNSIKNSAEKVMQYAVTLGNETGIEGSLSTLSAKAISVNIMAKTLPTEGISARYLEMLPLALEIFRHEPIEMMDLLTKIANDVQEV